MKLLRLLITIVFPSVVAFGFVSCAHRNAQTVDNDELVRVADNSPIQSSPTSKDTSPEALATATQRGASTAAADIKAGKVRILEYGGIMGLITKDSETGFPILSVAGCHYTVQIQTEADAYNEVMRKWHAKSLKNSTPK